MYESADKQRRKHVQKYKTNVKSNTLKEDCSKHKRIEWQNLHFITKKKKKKHIRTLKTDTLFSVNN